MICEIHLKRPASSWKSTGNQDKCKPMISVEISGWTQPIFISLRLECRSESWSYCPWIFNLSTVSAQKVVLFQLMNVPVSISYIILILTSSAVLYADNTLLLFISDGCTIRRAADYRTCLHLVKSILVNVNGQVSSLSLRFCRLWFVYACSQWCWSMTFWFGSVCREGFLFLPCNN